MSDTVTFVELAGADAGERLRAAAASTTGSTELLRSLERHDLWLLVVRGSAVHPPLGSRTWRFASEEAP
jgi:hypothetical protein